MGFATVKYIIDAGNANVEAEKVKESYNREQCLLVKKPHIFVAMT
ncbi:hypothetical protein ABXS75_17185 [Roseburia hominis]